MLEKMKNSFEVVEEKDIKNTLLYVKGINVNEESYETKILHEENIENVQKFQLVYEGDESCLCYNVSNTMSFEELIKTRKLKKKDICHILDSLDQLLTTIENYLISENSVSLDLRLVRVEKSYQENLRIRYILIPNFKSSFSFELSKFLIKILRYVDVEDKNALQLAYGLFVRSSKDNYTINDLMELVNAAREKKMNPFKDIDLEALNEYDEEMVDEIHDEIVENDVRERVPELSEFVDAEKSLEVTMDKNTTDILKDTVLDNFDNMPKNDKILKFKRKIFDFKPRKALNAHINLTLAKNILFSLVCLLIPLAFYMYYGSVKFSKLIPIICLCEIAVVTIFVIKRITKTK